MWNHRKKRKAIVTGILLLVLMAFGLRGLRIQSVSDYQRQQKVLTGELGLASPAASPQSLAESDAKTSTKKDTAAAKKTEPPGSQAPETTEVADHASDDQGSAPGKKSSPKKSGKSSQVSSRATKNPKETLSSSGKKPGQGSGSDRDTSTGTTVPAGTADTSATTPSDGIQGESAPGLLLPDDVPEPSDTQQQQTITCYLEIRCDTLVENKSKADKSIWEYIPADGTLLSRVEVSVEEGISAYGLLSKVCQSQNIALDAKYTPMYQSYYVTGIGHLYEKQAGSMSGWIYKVNGVSPAKGASSYILKQGDECVWSYTCDGKTG